MEDDAIIGTDGDDDLRGTSRDDVIRGLGGDDALRGRGGDDRLEGGRGDDTLRGGFGDDLLQGGEGDDTILGGGGLDIVSYADVGLDAAEETVTVRGVEVDFSDPGLDGFVEALVDRSEDGIDDEERDRILVSSADRRGVEGFEGSGYDDIFTGSDRDEVVIASLGEDRLDGGGGVDTIDYSDAELVEITVADDGGLRIEKADSFVGDFVTGFETVIGATESSVVPNSIGFFAASIVPSPLPLDVDLGAERLTIERGSIGEDDITIRVVGFEDVAGSRGDDTIVGSEADNFFGGTRGDDTYVGRDGRDVLGYYPDITGESVTTILGLGVATLLDGGEVMGRDSFAAFDVEAGTVDVIELVSADELRFAKNAIDASTGIAPGPVSVRIDLAAREEFSRVLGRVEATFAEDVGGFSAGDGFGFDVENFANVVGTDRDDVLLGDERANEIEGGIGDDVIRGRGGDDALEGGRGRDAIRGGDGDDRLDGQGGWDDLRGGGGDDRLDGRRGDDNLLGGAGDDRLFGQQGDDVLRGGRGADELGGGPGADTFRWTAGDIGAGAGVDVDIVNGFATEDFVLLAGRAFSADRVFELAQEEAVRGGVGFDLNSSGTQVVLRADGEDADAAIAAEEVFARLRLDPDDFALG